MPETFFKKLKLHIPPQWKVCFFASIIVGLIAHLYKITGWLPNWDSLVFRYDAQNMIGLGRWFLPVACSFTSFYDLPFLNGIIAILFHALSAVCICKILDVKKRTTAALIGAIVVSFPVVTSVMMYNYVADGYSIAFFLSTIAAMLIIKGKLKDYIIASVLIAFSSGIYQAYITVTVMLVLFKFVDEIIYNDAQFLTILKKGIFTLISGIGGVILYFVILKAILFFSSTELLDYQGINASISLSSLNLRGSLYVVKETFINFFFDFSEGINLYTILNVFVVLFTLICYVIYIIRNGLYKKPVSIFMLIILAVMLLCGATCLAFINADIDYHNLMLMGYVVFYMFFIILYEKGNDKTLKLTTIKCWIVLLTAVTIIANQVVISNVSYHKAQMAYEKSYGVLLRIVDRIEQTEDSENCNKILVIGALDDSKDYSVTLPPNITGITDGFIIRADDESVSQSVLCSTINDYCGKNYSFLSGEEKQTLLKCDEVKAMEKWPAKNSIAVVDDTIVIMLNSEGENK